MDALAGEEMRATRLSPTRRATQPRDTEANAESRMGGRRNNAYPYFQEQAQDLRTRSIDIDGQLASIESSMAPQVAMWMTQLTAAQTRVLSVQTEINNVGNVGYDVLDWILSAGGHLPSSVLSPKNSIESAFSEVKGALAQINMQISRVRNYGAKLPLRQEMSDLNQWAGGSNLKGMAENVCRSLSVTQREMLQGWWDMPSSGRYTGPSAVAAAQYRFLASGGIKPWQPVCDLYRHSLDPKSWATIERERGMGRGRSYGSTTAASLGGSAVYFQHPQSGQPGYTGFSAATRDVWGVSKVADGCLPGEACGIAPWMSPVTRTKVLIAQQQRGVLLVTSAQVGAIIRQVDTKLARVRTKLGIAHTKLGNLIDTLDNSDVTDTIKSTIRRLLRSAGVTTAFATAGGVAGPAGVVAGYAAGEISISVAVNAMWNRITSGPRTDRVAVWALKSQVANQTTPTTQSAFQWWESNTTPTWRAARRREIQTAIYKLNRWLNTYDSMESKCRSIYPTRSSLGWRRLGVEATCTGYETPTFERPSGWTPTRSPWLGGGGSSRRGGIPSGGGAREVQTAGLYGALEDTPATHFGLSKTQWLLLGALGAAVYYHKRKK